MKRLIVCLNGAVVGTLTQDASGLPGFRYNPEWLGNRAAIPLSRSLPVRDEPFRGKLAGGGDDSWGRRGIVLSLQYWDTVTAHQLWRVRTMAEKMKIGIVGCGAISGAYFGGATHCDNLEIVACADLREEAVTARAEEFGCAAVSVADLMADPQIDLVVNLTIPRAHVEVGLAAVAAGKHVYSEKPFAVDVDEGRRLVDAAAAAGVRLGCAPDTFLGGGVQTARKVLDDGWIGKPLSGVAIMSGRGHESWHPSPAFYYDIGGGPMFDMGPYYLTALFAILGPVRRVTGVTGRGFSERIATCEAQAGLRIPVNTSTHLTGVLEFCCGTIVTVIMSFDTWRHSLPGLELYGTEGSMKVPNPNGTGGVVDLWRPGADDWCPVPLAYPANARMIGVTDMVAGIMQNRPHRANGDVAFHMLEVMQAFDQSSATGEHVTPATSPDRPTPFPRGLAEWEVD